LTYLPTINGRGVLKTRNLLENREWRVEKNHKKAAFLLRLFKWGRNAGEARESLVIPNSF
jgi:hypothetical protein